jgi:hypothetical protein
MTTMHAHAPWLLLSMLATGCGAALSPAMRAFPGPEPQGAPPDQARVVFVRPSSAAFHSIFTLIDGHGYFLGDSSAGCRFSVFLAPGDHHVIAMTDEAASLRMTLSPGRTYYVEVRPKLGVWKPQVQLLAVSRQSGLLKSIPEYLARTKVTIPDFAAGQAHLYNLGSQAPEAAQRGVQAHAGDSPEAKAAATLQPEDGQ